MTQEEKDLLLIDLSARLPYKVKVCLYEKETCILLGIDGYEVYLDVDSDSFHIESIKPYLRPMEDMTREERYELQEIIGKDVEISDGSIDIIDSSRKTFSFLELKAVFSWINKNMFDYMGLIPMGLAIKVTKENNPYGK